MGSGQTISVVFDRIGPNNEVLTIGGRVKTAVASAFDIQPPNEDQWAALHPVAAAWIYVSLASNAGNWAASANSTNSWGDPELHNGRADAARHAYWNVLMAFSSLVGPGLAQQAGFAHERSNFENNAPHNEIAMDLTNNQGGLAIATALPPDSSVAQQQAAVVNAITTGSLVILDTLENSPPEGLLQPSNR